MYHRRQRVLINAAILTVLSTVVGHTRALAQPVNKAAVIQGTTPSRLDSIRAAIASQVVSRQPGQQRHFPFVVGNDSLVARRLLQEYGFLAAIRDTAVSDVALFGKVVRQQPDTSVIVPAGSVDTLIVGTAPPPPPADTNVRMPRIVDSSYRYASKVLTQIFQTGKLTLTPVVRGVNGSTRYALDFSVVDSQVPEANTPLSAQSDVQIIVRDLTTASGPVVPGTDTIPDSRPQPKDNDLWKWIAAAIAVIAAAIATTYTIRQRANQRGREQVAALVVVPHTDVGHPDVQFGTHDDETADEAFARIGLAFHAITDPGAQQIEFIHPPRSRDEELHV